MKTVYLIIFIGALLFASCEKCYTCQTTATTGVSGQSGTATTTSSFCGTKKEKADYEKAGTTSTHSQYYNSVTTTRCK